MNLIETYSSSTALKYKKPYIHKHHYPLPVNKYVVFHGGGGNGNFPSKIYDYWSIVIDFIKEPLQAAGYVIYQIGSKDEMRIDGCISLLGKTTYSQVNYILDNADLVFGNDSFGLHVAGMLDVPVVGVYGSTCPVIHGPHWKTENSILLKAETEGLTSFSAHEQEKTINKIKPEKIAESILSILNLKGEAFSTEYIGEHFGVSILEIIPNCILSADTLSHLTANIRADYEFIENNIYQQVSIRRSTIITDRPLNIEVLKQLKQNIDTVICKLDGEDLYQFVCNLKKAAIPFALLTQKAQEEIADLKMQFCDLGIITSDFTSEQPEELKEKENLRVKTAKVLISNQKMYHSYAHALEDVTENIIMDKPEFWKDRAYFYIYS